MKVCLRTVKVSYWKSFAYILNHLKKTIKMETSDTALKLIAEGQAKMYLETEKVFYNPVQEFNRDLSIAVLNEFTIDYIKEKQQRLKKNIKPNVNDLDNNSEPKIDFTILEALSATGLRSIRYAHEVPNVTKIIANDISEKAVQTIRTNVINNKQEDLIEISHEDACMLMYKHKSPSKRFSAIDLDPYGCPSIFLDAAVQSVQDGGLLLVTATDMAVLAGKSPETCYSKYGAVSLKTKCCHEMALRILLQCIEQHANRYSRYIVPLLSISADFYIRVFVKVYSGAIHCKKTTSKLSLVYQCVGCDTLTLQPLGGFKPNPSEKDPHQMKACLPFAPPVRQNCEHCGHRFHVGGPIWSAPIHDEEFVTRVLMNIDNIPYPLGTKKRIEGVLSMVREELQEVPLYYTLDKLFGKVHLETMSMLMLRSAILNSGHKVSYSHASKISIKTTAPAKLIWDIVRTWAKTHPAKPAKLESDPVAKAILSQEPDDGVDLSMRADANPLSRQGGLLRFQFNPTPHWGPGARALVNVGEGKLSKALKNQNKNVKKRKRNLLSQGDEDAQNKRTAEDSEII